MGTTYSIKIISVQNKINVSVLQKDIETILTDINQIMSTYIGDSELSILNRTRSTGWQTVSPDLYTVIKHADGVSRITNGAFDVTIGPLVNIWGFGPDQFTQTIPADKKIESLRQSIGYENILFNNELKQIAKKKAGLHIDLSGIAKGFAVDKIAQYLEHKNLQHYLVEIGGELIAKGYNAEQQVWQIGIEQASTLQRSVQRIIGLKDIAMATSGDYRNYFEKDGIRYSHTIDPNTGKPIIHKLASVTVLDESAMHADALATAFMVLGPEQAYRLANELDVAVYLIIKSGEGFEEKYNEPFVRYFSGQSR